MDKEKKYIAIALAVAAVIAIWIIIAIVLGVFDNMEFFSKSHSDYTQGILEQTNNIKLEK